MSDNEDPLTIPPKWQIGEKTAHPFCGLTPTLTAGVGQVEVRASIAMNLRSGCTVQLSVVALPEPPVHENRYGASRQRPPPPSQSLSRKSDTKMAASPSLRRRWPSAAALCPPSVGEAAGKPPCRYSPLVVLTGRVGLVDDLYGHKK